MINVSTGAGQVVRSVLNSVAPVMYFLLFILISVGFSLSILLPFVPLIYWVIACTNWVVSVLTGVVAGPLWAATHIGTEEGKGSRANYGYIFLIDAAIRPSLMVFGFFFASLIVVAVGTLLNLIMLPAMANVQANSMTGVMSVIGILMIYARICSTLVSSAFSLQVYLPDYVIAWLGGRESSQMMRGAVESAKNMFIGFGAKLERTPGLKKWNPKRPLRGGRLPELSQNRCLFGAVFESCRRLRNDREMTGKTRSVRGQGMFCSTACTQPVLQNALVRTPSRHPDSRAPHMSVRINHEQK